ncbi:hypothetical protein [Candidatus Kuenenia sp.]|uniref:hypothetical protein n=1 Tax=Candidatus Kuenenia sp. TaxID=2499824 RepID=UPI0032207E36
MKIEYIGEILPDGHLSLEKKVLKVLNVGEKVKVRLENIKGKKSKERRELDPATKRILDRINNPKPIGVPDDPGMFSHSKLAEERIDEKFPCTE